MPVACALLLAVGCGPPPPKLDLPDRAVGIHEPLWEPLDKDARFVIGEVKVTIDEELADDEIPTSQEIDKLKAYLHWHMNHTYLFEVVGRGAERIRYEIRGEITRFRRGSTTARVFGLSRLGRTYIVVELNVIDLQDGGIAFGGVFRSELKRSAETGEHVLDDVASAFADELRRQYLGMLNRENGAED